MKHEPASVARHAAAVRLMQRVEAITRQVIVEPVVAPGERGVALATRHLLDELEGLRLAERGPLRRSEYDGYYRPRLHSKGGVHVTTIHRLIAKGLMEYGNSIKTFVVLTEAGRASSPKPESPDTWERGLCRFGRNDRSIG